MHQPASYQLPHGLSRYALSDRKCGLSCSRLPLDIFDIGQRFKENFEKSAGCSQPKTILVVLTRGLAQLQIPGESWVVNEDSLLVTNSVNCRRLTFSDDATGFILLINHQHLHAMPVLEEHLINRGLSWKIATCHAFLKSSERNNLTETLKAIRRETLNGEAGHNILISIRLLGLFFQLDQMLHRLKRRLTEEPLVTLEKFQQLIRSTCQHKKSVTFYAERLGLTVSQLNAYCRKYHFTGAKGMIDRVTILHAKILLQDRSLLIKEVAMRVGFCKPCNFSHYFRKHTGILPLAYRAAKDWL